MMGEPMGGPPSGQSIATSRTRCGARAARLAAGASLREPTTMFYGDRISMVKDAWGNVWAISTHVEDVSPDEMMRRMASQKK
jgi:uncharacterized glyoxalase superfamily protein PhnB